ncbi:MAG: glycosyltransferase family 4 protein [Cyanobacteria bacterium P01_F01_bin.33]
MKTILHINTLYYPDFLGGAERSVQVLAERMAARGYQTVVLALTKKHQPQEAIHNGVKTYHVPLRNIYWPFDSSRKRNTWISPAWHVLDRYNWAMAAAVDRVLEREQPDLVNTHNLPGWSVVAWNRVKARHIPLAHTLRDYNLLCLKTSMFRREIGENCAQQCRSCVLFSQIKQAESRHVDTAIGISQFILDLHLKYRYFPSARQQVAIGNPIALPTEIEAKVNTALPLRFGFIGKLSRHKGIEILLEAARMLPENGWQLAIGGKCDADYMQRLQQLSEGLPVQFLGYVNPDEFYRSIDIAIVPSVWNEPFGRVIVEAYAYGVPAVVSHVGGASELIEDGKSGYAYDASAAQLADTMRRCLERPETIPEMSAHCLQLARQFSTDAICDRYLDIYADTVATASDSPSPLSMT